MKETLFTNIRFGEKMFFSFAAYKGLAALTGHCSVTPVPPLGAAALFLGSGLLGLAAWRKFKKV